MRKQAWCQAWNQGYRAGNALYPRNITCSGSKSLKFILIDSNIWNNPLLSPLVTLCVSPNSTKDFFEGCNFMGVTWVVCWGHNLLSFKKSDESGVRNTSWNIFVGLFSSREYMTLHTTYPLHLTRVRTYTLITLALPD